MEKYNFFLKLLFVCMCVQFFFSFSHCCFERCGTWLFELAFSIVHTLGEALRVSVLAVSSNFIADLKYFRSIGVADSFFFIYIYICILSLLEKLRMDCNYVFPIPIGSDADCI